MQLAPGNTIAECIRLDQLLKDGGIGSFWVGTYLPEQVPALVRLVSGEVASHNPGIRVSLEREAKVAVQLVNPHIVKVLEHGELDDGGLFLATELLEGESLGERLELDGALNMDEAEQIVSQSAAALTVAHKRGVVHRKITPDNIFLVHSPEEPEDFSVKVLELGVGRPAHLPGLSALTSAAETVGTPEYMSPEQALGDRPVDYRADLWALAVVTYQMITGRVPFVGSTLKTLCHSISSGAFSAPSNFRKDIPTELDKWFRRAFNPRAVERFSSAQQMTDDFANAVDSLRQTHELDPSLHDRPAIAEVAVPAAEAPELAAHEPSAEPSVEPSLGEAPGDAASEKDDVEPSLGEIVSTGSEPPPATAPTEDEAEEAANDEFASDEQQDEGEESLEDKSTVPLQVVPDLRAADEAASADADYEEFSEDSIPTLDDGRVPRAAASDAGLDEHPGEETETGPKAESPPHRPTMPLPAIYETVAGRRGTDGTTAKDASRWETAPSTDAATPANRKRLVLMLLIIGALGVVVGWLMLGGEKTPATGSQDPSRTATPGAVSTPTDELTTAVSTPPTAATEATEQADAQAPTDAAPDDATAVVEGAEDADTDAGKDGGKESADTDEKDAATPKKKPRRRWKPRREDLYEPGPVRRRRLDDPYE